MAENSSASAGGRDQACWLEAMSLKRVVKMLNGNLP